MAENKVGISGADYIIPPKADHPFWSDEEEIAENLTATATVDNSTGTPSVDVTKNGYNLDFAFKNLKGEKGDKGDTGAKGTPGADGKTGTSVIVSKVNTPESGAVVGRITGLKSQELDPTIPSSYETIEVRNGEKGEKGDTGATGATGATGEAGPQGPQGESGPQGPQGEVGPQGPQGIQGPAGKDGVSPIVTSTGSTESGASAGTITDATGNKITVYNGARGADATATYPLAQGLGLVWNFNVPTTSDSPLILNEFTKADLSDGSFYAVACPNLEIRGSTPYKDFRDHPIITMMHWDVVNTIFYAPAHFFRGQLGPFFITQAGNYATDDIRSSYIYIEVSDVTIDSKKYLYAKTLYFTILSKTLYDAIISSPYGTPILSEAPTLTKLLSNPAFICKKIPKVRSD